MDFETEMLDAHDMAEADRFLKNRIKTIQPEGVMSGGVPTMTDAERAEQLKTVGTDIVEGTKRTIGSAATSLGQQAANIGSDLLQDTANQMIAPTLQTTEGEDIKLKAPIFTVPQVKTANGLEALMSDIVQFGMGMAITPGHLYVKGAASAFAFDPVEADLAGALNELGVLPAALEFLTSTPEEMETAEGRMRQRLMNVLQETAIAGSVDGIIRVVKNVKNTPEVMDRFTTAIRNKFVEAGQAADVRIAERATDTSVTLGSGVDPTDVVDRIISAQARYFETGNYQPPTKENPVSVVKPTEDEPGIIAFHGSGADFDEFRVEMIGTGEGAQAYGYGLYFTDNEDIAKFYKETGIYNQRMRGNKLAIYYQGKPFEDLGDTAAAEAQPPSYFAISSIAEEMAKYLPANPQLAKPELAKERLLKRLDVEIEKYSKAGQNDAEIGSVTLEDGGTLEQLLLDDAQIRKQALLDINSEDIKPAEGKMYKVGLAPKPDELLDYDKSLSEQSDSVQEKAKKVLSLLYPDVKNPALSMRGSDLQKQIENRVAVSRGNIEKMSDPIDADINRIDPNNQKSEAAIAAQIMSEAGIPGIKYRAAGSRATATADEAAEKNYVIFDDNAVKILEKYGIAAPVAVTATAASLQTDEAEANPILRKAVSSLAKNTTDVKKKLTDDVARLARAREQGFEVDNPVYHGTNSDNLLEFDERKIGTSTDAGYYGKGIYFASNPGEASYYGKNVGEYVVRGKFLDLNNKTGDYALGGAKKFIGWATQLDEIGALDDFHKEGLEAAKKLVKYFDDNVEFTKGQNPDGTTGIYATIVDPTQKPQVYEGKEYDITVDMRLDPRGFYAKDEKDAAEKLFYNFAYKMKEPFGYKDIDFFDGWNDDLYLSLSDYVRVGTVGAEELSKKAKAAGYDGIKADDETVVFDPKNIRLLEAEFDPKKIDSPKLLSSRDVQQESFA